MKKEIIDEVKLSVEEMNLKLESIKTDLYDELQSIKNLLVK
jgi:hypothetical protein